MPDDGEALSFGSGEGEDIEAALQDRAKLGMLISRVEDRAAGSQELLRDVAAPVPGCHIVGVTGPPGAGKSTLVDKLVERYRDEGRRVGVIAVDPRSDVTGGAFLGDRVRLTRSANDEGVFYRSLSTSGTISGTLAGSTVDVLSVLDAAGMDVVIIETVGAGQTDTEIANIADTVLLVLPPGGGDQIQISKSGILEIGDVFVVNKADLDGAEEFASNLRDLVTRQQQFQATNVLEDAVVDPADDWEPRIIKTVATEGRNVDDLVSLIEAHWTHLEASEDQARRREALVRKMLQLQLEREIRDELARRLEELGGFTHLLEDVLAGEENVYDVVEDVDFSATG